LDRVEGRGTYDDDDETIQTVTVHARHGHVAGDLVTTRTITYTGAGGLTPAPSICQINWVYDTNSVTGKTVYTPSGTCPAVVTPTLAGFTANTAVVPAWAPGTTEKRPADTAVTVKYAAETAALPVTGSRDAWSVSLIALGALLVGLALTVVARRMPTRSR
ncbi:MAG: hypothetical protein LBO20_02800, partial [Bifidobacteriaceae bacterium]|nr:hypothetical protein [Bifidobacteriaceae bacterium]